VLACTAALLYDLGLRIAAAAAAAVNSTAVVSHCLMLVLSTLIP
jgi:hypothetical protein